MIWRVFKKVILPIIIFILILFLLWFFWQKKIYKIQIIDKTVLTKDCQEHSSLNWILTNQRFVKPDSTIYNIDEDYLGFFPLEDYKFEINDLRDYKTQEIKALADSTDMLYYTDSYGVYEQEWKEGDYVTEFSKRIYGGMSKEEAAYILEMKKQDKPIILEFNTFASPTSYRVRKKIIDEFDLIWSGWNGRYFDTLDSLKNAELPRWLIKSYEEQYMTDWDFDKPGIAFVHISGKVLILELGKYLDYEAPMIITKNETVRDYYNLPEKIVYPFWFDVVYPKKDKGKVLSRYKIYTTPLADSLLKDNGLWNTFPAVIHNQEANFYYFSGDFADNVVMDYLAYFKFVDLFFQSFLYQPRDIVNRSRFFWKYYNPMMKVIMRDNYQEFSKKKINEEN